MAGLRRMMSILGLVDEDEYDEYDPYEERQQAATRPTRPTSVPVEPEGSPTAIRPLGRDSAEQPSGVTITPRPSVVRPITPVASAKPHTVAPTSFDDVREIGDRLKAGVPVIVNVQTVDRDLMRRIVDF